MSLAPVTPTMGLHPHGDPHVRDDFARVELAIEATEPHDSAAEWRPDGIRWSVDGTVVRTSDESPRTACS
jgi:hypothetical protein